MCAFISFLTLDYTRKVHITRYLFWLVPKSLVIIESNAVLYNFLKKKVFDLVPHRLNIHDEYEGHLNCDYSWSL